GARRRARALPARSIGPPGADLRSQDRGAYSPSRGVSFGKGGLGCLGPPRLLRSSASPAVLGPLPPPLRGRASLAWLLRSALVGDAAALRTEFSDALGVRRTGASEVLLR